MAGTAAIYTRISKDREGQQQGVARQEQLARELAARKGLEVVAVFSDNDVSASTRSTKVRPQYAEMMRRAREGEFGAILAYSYSRLTRRPQEFNDLIDLAESKKVTIATIASGEFDLNLASGRAVARTVAAWDAAEAEQASERIKAQKQQRADRGDWHGGIAPFGYRSANATLEVVPSEVELILEAATRILAGDSLASVVKDWNARPIPTRFGKHWRQTNLRSILMNPTMLGKTKTGAAGNWPAVMEQRTFDRLQRVFNDPARKTNHSPGVKSAKYAMGGGITVCAICGHRLISASKRGRGHLKCTKVVNGPTACGHVVVDHDRLEEHVFTTIVESLTSDDRWAREMSDRGPDVDAKITTLEAERDELLEKQRRLHDMRLEGLVDDDYHRANVASIKADYDSTQRKINDLLGRPQLSEAVKDGLDWRAWSSDKRRNFLKVLGVRVEVSPWPTDVKRNFYKRNGETVEAFHARQDDLYREATAKRANILVGV